MAVTINAKGTSYPSYTIGKQGTAIYQGSTEPGSPNTGDVWIKTTDGSIKSYSGSAWVNLVFDDLSISGSTITADGGTLNVTGAITSTDNITTGEITISDAQTSIRKLDTAGFLNLSGSTNTATGGNIMLYGSTHATLAGDIRLRSGSTDILHYDLSATKTTITDDLTVTGDIVATSFAGDGSLLTNLPSPSISFTLITGAYTAVARDRLAIDVSGGAYTVTLPASATAGDVIEFIDNNGDLSTDNLTIARNGHNIDSIAEDLTVSDGNVHFWLQYVDVTAGWEVFGIVGGSSSSLLSLYKVTPQTGGGALAASATHLLKDSNTYTLPLADSVSVNESIIVELPQTYSAQTPIVQRSGSDTITYDGGTDTTFTFDNGAQVVRFTSNGNDSWEI